MASFKTICCAAILLISCHYAFSLTSTSSIFLWSNKNFFTGSNIQELNSHSARDIINGLQQKSSPLSQFFNSDASKPELIVLFVEPKLSTVQIPTLANAYETQPTGGAFVNLKKYVETSESSLVVPYVISSSAASQIISALSTQVKNVYVIGESSISQAITITLSDLQNKNWEALNNGVTDLVVVQFSSHAVDMSDESAIHNLYAADDKIVGEVMEAVESVNYVAILASDAVSATADNSSPDIYATRSEHIKAFERQFSQDGDVLYTTYWPDGVIEGLVVMAPFLGILFIGICCTFQLQSDLKFDAEKTILRRQ